MRRFSLVHFADQPEGVEVDCPDCGGEAIQNDSGTYCPDCNND